MFQFPGFASRLLRISRLQRDGFPHSEICGCIGYLLLPAAYRSLSRPSSPLRAKAFTMRPFFIFSNIILLIFHFLPVCQRTLFNFGVRNFEFGFKSEITNPKSEMIISLMKYSRREVFMNSDCGFGISDLLIPKSSFRIPKFRLIFSRKEVFQPHLPVRLPCYDLAPVTGFTLGRSLRLRTSGTPNFHGLTGGVYKARERIHRAMADARLLANPASRSRVADSDPN